MSKRTERRASERQCSDQGGGSARTRPAPVPVAGPEVDRPKPPGQDVPQSDFREQGPHLACGNLTQSTRQHPKRVPRQWEPVTQDLGHGMHLVRAKRSRGELSLPVLVGHLFAALIRVSQKS